MADKIRVLAVDDAAANLAVIRGCLRGGNFELTTKNNALDALQSFKDNFFDVVLLDVLMPGISGFELRKLIREIDKERPIIFFTSMIDDANMTMLNQISWDPNTFYLSKLIDREVLVRKICEVTQSHRMRQSDRDRSNKLEEELHIAGNLQKMLLPPWCIMDDVMAAGSVYAPALLTSGDVFDVVKLSDKRYLYFLGDISGHGISAALYMTAIYTYLKMLPNLAELGPEEIMDILNKFVCRKIKNNAYLTAVVMIVDYDKNQMLLHSAGHLPVLCYSASDGKLTNLECLSDAVPLGWFEESVYKAEDTLVVQLKGDELFLAYTDGIYDLQDDTGQTMSTEEFNELVESVFDGADAIVLPHRILEVMFRLGYKHQNDDITFLAFQKHHGVLGAKEMIIPPQLPYVDKLAAEFASITEDTAMQMRIELCLHEYLNNAIIHGRKSGDSDRPIYAEILPAGETFVIRILEDGEPWNVTEKESGNEDFSAPELATSGRGLQIMQSITESMKYDSFAGVNEVIFELKKSE